MKLESVRELKADLLAKQLQPLTKQPKKAAGFALAATNRESVDRRQPALALGIARRSKGDYRLAVRIQDRAFEVGGPLERIRKRARNEVDVRYIGWVDKQTTSWHQLRQRPLLIGSSIGHHVITAGTLGAFARRASDAVLVLSNNHVLANENEASAGDPILQPGRYDGGTLQDRIAKLDTFVPLRTSGANLVDAALAALDPGIGYDSKLLRGLGTLSGVASGLPGIGDAVAKVGRTTGVTRGRVTAFDLDNLIVGYDMGTLRFDNQIEVEGAAADAFSAGGDSGSLIVDAEMRACALLFAGSDQGGSNGRGLTFANPIHVVLSALSITMLI